MKNLLKNKLLSWVALILAIIYLVVTFSWKASLGWWAFCDGFFVFMAIFVHLCALYLSGLNPYASKKLDLFAFVSFILFILSFIIEWVIFEVTF